MKKIWIFVLLAVGMIACTDKNAPEDTTTNTDTEAPGDTTLAAVDTIAIVWNGANATITGSHDSVSVTSSNGYVTVNSMVRDISYTLSGNGQGQLTIYGTNRHQLVLNNLTLTCSDGPAINNQCKKSCFVVLQGTNSLTDGSSYASSEEDRKGTFFSEGQVIMSGGGSLTIKGNYKNGLCSDDYIHFMQSTGKLTITAVNKGIEANEGIYFDGGTFVINAGGEGIESDSVLVVNGGEIYVKASDDAINSGDDLTISGGMVMAYSTGNDGIDGNGNCYIQGGLVYAIGARSPEVAIDANSEEQKKLYVQGGTLVAIGGLESGASLSQSCYAASSWSQNTWYALTVGSNVFAFKTPSSSGTTMVVSGASTPTLTSGVTASGTSIFNGMGYYPASVSGGSSVSLSSYSGGNSGGGHGGGGPGGH